MKFMEENGSEDEEFCSRNDEVGLPVEGSEGEDSAADSDVSVYDSDVPSDGEDGMKFMARVRALEMKEREEKKKGGSGVEKIAQEEGSDEESSEDVAVNKKNVNRRSRAKKAKNAKRKAMKKASSK